MSGRSLRLDPRTVPRARFLDRLGERRPELSIVAFLDGRSPPAAEALRGLGRPGAPGRQLILAACAHPPPPSAALARQDGESLPAFANRAATAAIGRLLLLLPPEARLDDVHTGLPALLDRLAADPWLGAALVGGGTGGLLARESLWTALGGFDAAFLGWASAVQDLCLRARAIGYAAPADPLGDEDGPDARLLAQRRALAPARAMPALPAAGGRLTVYTAITAGYDTLKPQPATALLGCERVAFLDRGSAARLAGCARGWRVVELDPRPGEPPPRAARHPKINAHLALPGAGYSLWIDASIGITCPFPLPRLIELFLGEADICVFRHYARRSIYEEAEACKAYGLDRAEVIDAQVARYRAEGLPEASGLIEAPILLRRHTPAMARLNAAWWAEVVRGSQRDQLSFNYAAWKLGQRYATFPLSVALRNGLFVKFRRELLSGRQIPTMS